MLLPLEFDVNEEKLGKEMVGTEPFTGCGVKKSYFILTIPSSKLVISSITGGKSCNTSPLFTCGNCFLNPSRSPPLLPPISTSKSVPS